VLRDHRPSIAEKAEGRLEFRAHSKNGRRSLENPQAVPKPRSTDRAGIRLRVKAPVFRVLILGEAGGAHDEWGHACIRAVIWDGAHNGEAGAAMGAIREGIAEAPVFWIADIREAIGAGGGIGNHACAKLAALALHDNET